MKREVEILDDEDKWIKSIINTKAEFEEQYSNANPIVTTDKYNYYSVGAFKFLYRIAKLPTMTKAEAEEKYNIEIQG